MVVFLKDVTMLTSNAETNYSKRDREESQKGEILDLIYRPKDGNRLNTESLHYYEIALIDRPLP